MSGESPNNSGEFAQEDIDAQLSSGTSPSEVESAASDDPPLAAETHATTGAGEADMSVDPTGTEEVRVDASGRPFDETADAMAAAIAEERAAAVAGADQPSTDMPLPPGVMSLDLPELGTSNAPATDPQGMQLLHDVELNVKIELGRAEMYIEDVLKLREGSVVELDKLAGDPVDVLVNERLVARGEVLVLNDNFCVRINEVFCGVADEESN